MRKFVWCDLLKPTAINRAGYFLLGTAVCITIDRIRCNLGSSCSFVVKMEQFSLRVIAPLYCKLEEFVLDLRMI